MENKSSLLQFNYFRYKRLLSPFGRKVLEILDKQWKLEDDNKRIFSQRRQYSAQKKKMITFRDSHDANFLTPRTYGPINPEGQLNKEDVLPFNYNVVNNSCPDKNEVRTSCQLVKPAKQNKPEEKIYTSTHDLIHPVLDNTRKSVNLAFDLYNRDSDEENQIPLIKIPEINYISDKKDVDWEDMFDTELLSDTYDSQIINPSANLLTTKPLLDEFSEKLPTEHSITYKTNTEHYSEKYVLIGNKRLPKRKDEIKITDMIPKKVKKTQTGETKTKNSFRKQKYTKAIKNWLEDVDKNNVLEEVGKEPSEIVKEPVNKIVASELIIEKVSKTKQKKNVVQSKLENKGGVMKFGKPKNDKNEVNDSISIVKAPEPVPIKEKKGKAKFVVPIKSQIPVKEVHYNIHRIDDDNFGKYFEDLSNTQNKDVIMVLMYSNGFSQLNSHYTDDNCNSEAIMICIDETFYYLRCGQENFRILMTQMMENTIICYDGKSLFVYFISNGLQLKCLNVIDAKIGGSLLDPDNSPDNFTDLQTLLSFTPQYTIATECVLQKTSWYLTLLKECAANMRVLLMENSLWNVFVDIEMRLLPTIANMEYRGVSVDVPKLKTMEDVLLTKIKAVEQECYKAAGKVFQINSTVQVRGILYDELQLDTKCNVKIRETIIKGAKSTSETMLRSLISEHPLPKLILEYRHLHKAHATFLTGIAQHVKDNVVRPTWVQTAAATGRIASNNPNLQAIPKAPFSLTLFPDAGENDEQVVKFRSVYKSREGYTFLAADFKHVECRVFAHAAADTGLMEALKSREDLFKVLAAKWLNKPESSVSNEDRDRTKRIVYANLYGAGTRKLMDILEISYDQALSVVTSFNRTFPCLKSFGRSVVSRCVANGGRLTTLCGRGRRFKHISSSDFALKSHAERQAVNFVVQGSAADLCKMAMVNTDLRLRSSEPPIDGHLVLQIHDELVWEIRDQDMERAAAIIKEVMENCGYECGMALTLPVALSKGNNWGEMMEILL